MEIKIEKTKNTPLVILDSDNKSLKFEGRSFPEHPISFYSNIMDLIKSNYKTDSLEIIMEFDYINTSSAKCILNMLKELKIMFKYISVIWISEEDDEDTIEIGNIFCDISKIPFTFKEVI